MMVNIKSYIASKFIGLVFLFFFCATFSSILNTYFGFSYFKALEPESTLYLTLSGFGFVITDLFSIASWLLPLFFLIIGLKKIMGINIRFVFIRSISIFLSIFFINVLINFFPFLFLNLNFSEIGTDRMNSREVGDHLFAMFNENFEFIFSNKLIALTFFFLLLILSILILIFSLSLKNRLIINIIINIFSFFIKIIKLFRLLAFFKKIFKLKKITEKKEIGGTNSYTKVKKEPTIEKGNIVKKDLSVNKDLFLSKVGDNMYALPPLSLLKTSQEKKFGSRETIKQNEINAKKLEEILRDYGVVGNIVSYKTGPVITLFEFQPSPGVKTSKVIGLAPDIARSMSSMSARISTLPGKNAIGIEIPNNERQDVYLGDLLKDVKFDQKEHGLILALGKNIAGEKIYTDLEKMPHLLIAGTTGSGKSVGINSMILSLLFRFKPSECKFILIDPKMLELSVYENIPHLLAPVVTDSKKAVFALKWVVREVENRYRVMNAAGVKNIKSFNSKIQKYLSSGEKFFREVQTGIDRETRIPIIEKQEIPLEPMALIVVVVDEMADLMTVAGKEVEHLIQRLAQMARASGIHLITATQRPSVDVITGTIKANFPSRISFRVASKFDSRTILNEMGAEQLLGRGDMLFLENGANLIRIHGGYVSENEIANVVRFINSQSTSEKQVDITKDVVSPNNDRFEFGSDPQNVDTLYQQAISIVIQQQKASTSFIQRYLQIGYNRAARIIEQMEKEGIISEANHVGKRNVLKKN